MSLLPAACAAASAVIALTAAVAHADGPRFIFPDAEATTPLTAVQLDRLLTANRLAGC